MLFLKNQFVTLNFELNYNERILVPESTITYDFSTFCSLNQAGLHGRNERDIMNFLYADLKARECLK